MFEKWSLARAVRTFSAMALVSTVVTFLVVSQRMPDVPDVLITDISYEDLTTPSPTLTPSASTTPSTIAVLVSGQQSRLESITILSLGAMLASLKANCNCQIHVFYHLVRREDGVEIKIYSQKEALHEKTSKEMVEINAHIESAMASAGVKLVSNIFEDEFVQMEYNNLFGQQEFEAISTKNQHAYGYASQYVNLLRGYRVLQRFEAEQGFVTSFNILLTIQLMCPSLP